MKAADAIEVFGSGTPSLFRIARRATEAPVVVGQEAAKDLPNIKEVVVVGGGPASVPRLDTLLAAENEGSAPARTCADEVAYWLYSSGTTGNPKGTMHVHSTPMNIARTSGQGRIGIREDDVIFSAPFSVPVATAYL